MTSRAWNTTARRNWLIGRAILAGLTGALGVIHVFRILLLLVALTPNAPPELRSPISLVIVVLLACAAMSSVALVVCSIFGERTTKRGQLFLASTVLACNVLVAGTVMALGEADELELGGLIISAIEIGWPFVAVAMLLAIPDWKRVNA